MIPCLLLSTSPSSAGLAHEAGVVSHIVSKVVKKTSEAKAQKGQTSEDPWALPWQQNHEPIPGSIPKHTRDYYLASSEGMTR